MQWGRTKGRWCNCGLAIGMLSVIEFRYKFAGADLQRGIRAQESSSPSPCSSTGRLAIHSTALPFLLGTLVTGGRCRSLKGICDSIQQLESLSWVLYNGGGRSMPQHVIRCSRGKACLVSHTSLTHVGTAVAPAAA